MGEGEWAGLSVVLTELPAEPHQVIQGGGAELSVVVVELP